MSKSKSLAQHRYCCLSEVLPSEGEYHITSIRYEDIFKIKIWRNEQMDILRQKTILTDEVQNKYFNTVIFPDFSSHEPRNILVSYFCQSILIGYGGLVHIDWEARRAEVSFLLDPSRVRSSEKYKKDFIVFLSLIKGLAQSQLKLNRLFTETYDVRPVHIKCLEESGFLFEGRMRKHVVVAGQLTDSLIHGCLLGETNV